jgi:protein-disulfide isomerase-like protein with CxxC motif
MKTVHPDPRARYTEAQDLDDMAVLHKLAEQSGDGMVTELFRLAMDRSHVPAFPRPAPPIRRL